MPGMFDDLEKQQQAEEKTAKAGLFADLKEPSTGVPGLKSSPSTQVTKPEPALGTEVNSGAPSEPTLKEKYLTYAGIDPKSPAPETDPKKLMEFLGLDPNNPDHVAIAKKMQPGTVEHATNQILGKFSAGLAKLVGLDHAAQFWKDKASEAVIPGSPIASVVQGAPAVAAATVTDFAKGAIPSSLMDYGLLFAGGGVEKLDEALATGYKNVANTAPTATSQLLRSMMEVEDPIAKANLLKKSAPVLLGRSVADSVTGLPPTKIGVHPPDVAVSKVMGDLGEKAPEIFRRGLESFTDKDLKTMGNLKQFNEVKKLLAEGADPAKMQEIVGNFTPAQQRMITRRGLGTIDNQVVNGKSEASKLFGTRRNLTKSIMELNKPVELTPDQQDVARSLALRENLQDTTKQWMEKGVASPQPNLEKVEAALSARAPRSTPLQEIMAKGQQMFNETRDLLEFEPRLQKFPQFRQELEGLASYAVQAARESTSLLGATVEGLSSKEEFETFRKLIILNDWKEALESGSTKIVANLSKEEVNGAMAKYASKATSSVLEAMERHYEIVSALGHDLVKRGYLTEDMLKDKYFRHRVIGYLDENMAGDPGAGGRTGGSAPFRTYVLGRVNNAELIDTDYLDVMHKLYSKVKIDNKLEDFIRAQATKLDKAPSLPDDLRLQLFGEGASPKINQRYVIDGEAYRGYRYFPKNAIYSAERQAEQIITSAVENSMDAAELDQRLQGVNQRLENQRVYLLPEEVHSSLVRMNQPQNLSAFYDLIRHSTRLWKRLTLTAAGVPWQVANFTGSLEALYREGDFGAIAKIPEAIIRLGRSQLNPEQVDEMVQKAAAHNLVLPPEHAITPAENPDLLKFMDNKTQFLETLKAPLKLYEKVGQGTIGSPKFAKFMADTARIQKGQEVVTKTWGPELEGLTAEQKVVRANKLTLVEFSTNNPKFNTMFRDFLFPFASFYYNNTKAWATYLARNPGDAVIKFGVPYAAMQYWNWSRFPEVEKGMEDWRRYQPHVITGKIDEQGNHIIITHSSIFQEAARWVDGEGMLYRTTQVAAGELSLKDAVKAQLASSVKAPTETAWNLLNPFVGSMIALAENHKKPAEGGGQIVPDRLQDTSQGAQAQMEYLLRNLVTPLSTFYRTEAKEEATPANPLLRFFKYGPLDVERAAGIRRVDLNKAERAIRFSRAEEAKTLNNQNYADLEDAYVKSQVQNDPQAYTNALEQYSGKIPLPPGRDLAHFLKSPRVQLRIKRELLKGSTNAEERDRLVQEVKDLEETQSYKSVKGAPRQERSFILEGAPTE